MSVFAWIALIIACWLAAGVAVGAFYKLTKRAYQARERRRESAR